MRGKRIPEHLRLARFLAFVRKTDDCWVWTGHRFPNGYGCANMRGKTLYAHRLSFVLHVGPVPNGMNVCHHCDNRPCVRPDHLFLGTQRDNLIDASRKGRLRRPGRVGRRGESNHLSIITEDDVRAIRARRAAGEMYHSIARDYPIGSKAVGMIVRRERWAHVA